jgi:hypothetical protein
MGRLLFNLFLLSLAAYFVWSAFAFDPQARQIPLLIGGMVLILQTWVTIKAAVAGEGLAETHGGDGPPPANEGARVAAAGGWIVLFFALFVGLGTLSATFLFLLLFLVRQPGVSLLMSFGVAAAVSIAIWLLFVRLMRFELYPGVLFGGTLPLI